MATGQSFIGLLERFYASQATNQRNTCSVGTWAINRDQILNNQNDKGGFLKNLLNRFRTNSGKTQVSEEKNTSLVNNLSESTCAGGKILVVSKGAAFSGNVVSYAIEMAARTKSSLVALNLDEQGADFDNFCSKSEQNISKFSDKAQDAGLLFAHVVKQGAEDSVVAALHEEDEQVRYVMEDVNSQKSTGRAIPVYTRAMLRVK